MILFKRYFSFFLFLFIATAPILWLPGINSSSMRLIKILLISIAIVIFFYGYIYNKVSIKAPTYLFIMCGLCTILFPLFLLNSSEYFTESLSYTLNFIFGFITIIIGFNFYNRFKDYTVIFRNLYILIILIVVFPISNFFFEFPDWNDQLPEVRDYGIRALWYTGFSAHRTGWSETLSLFVTLPFFFLENSKKRSIVLYLIIILPVVTAQILSTSRTGFLCSFFALVIFIFKKTSKTEITGFFAVATGLIIMFYSDILIILRVSSDSGDISDTSDISSGRSDMYVNFFNIFLKKPIQGSGFQGSGVELSKIGIDQEMHNSLLRVMIDHGLIFGILAIMLSLEAFRMAISTLSNKDESTLSNVFSMIILQGLFIAMFSPAFIFGGFQVSSLWWLSVGMLAKERFLKGKLVACCITKYR